MRGCPLLTFARFINHAILAFAVAGLRIARTKRLGNAAQSNLPNGTSSIQTFPIGALDQRLGFGLFGEQGSAIVAEEFFQYVVIVLVDPDADVFERLDKLLKRRGWRIRTRLTFPNRLRLVRLAVHNRTHDHAALRTSVAWSISSSIEQPPMTSSHRTRIAASK